MKKFLVIAFLLAFGFIVGFGFSFLEDNNVILAFTRSFSHFKWYYIILVIILVFALNITVHEMGHLIIFVLNKVKIRGFVILFVKVVFYKEKKPKIFFDFSLLKLLGGFVVPNVSTIDEAKYNKLRKVFSKSLLFGPLSSIIFTITTFVIFVLLFAFKIDNASNSIMFVVFIETLLICLLVIRASRVSMNNIYGDFVANKKILNDDAFYTITLLSYQQLSDSYDFDIFLFNKLEHLLLDKKYSNSYKDLMLYYFNYCISNELCKPNNDIDFDFNINSVDKDSYEIVYIYGLFNYIWKSLDTYNECLNWLSLNETNDEAIFYYHLLSYNTNDTDCLQYLLENVYIFTDELIFKHFIDSVEDTKEAIKRFERLVKES
jgi:hypothetical protein